MTALELHHAGIRVSDLERSIGFYHRVFGLEVVERLRFGDETIAFLSIGAARLELIEAGGSPRPTGVVDHVAFEVDDLDALLLRLRDRGVTLLDETPVAVPDLNARILFCLGPDAERLELFEYNRSSGKPKLLR